MVRVDLTQSFASFDGTRLAYRVLGEGAPVMCLPGGPGRSVDYLGDLGGLADSNQLILLDPRGVGASKDPADPTTFRADRLVADVESLRAHLKLDRFRLLAHSAGAVLATLYAARFPERLSRLALITPSLSPLGVDADRDSEAVFARLTNEEWYPSAMKAWSAIKHGDFSLDNFRISRPLFYGHWNAQAEAHGSLGMADRHMAARRGYFSDLDIDVDAIRRSLAGLDLPVLLYVGDLDPLVTPAMATEAATRFENATVVVQAGAGHYPWLDNPTAFADAVRAFLL